jgi:RNA polymerase sigma factor (sigma-70 family)
MTESPLTSFPNHIRHLIGSLSAAGLTDGQLLERFLANRDETAIEMIVRRYGSLVLGVCRRVLHNAHAAEDAFQATFLVLVRKAPSLDRGKPLGSWLYTVAYRLALTARANEFRRRRCEGTAARSRPTASGAAPCPSDLLVALEEELNRLPPKHRAALVLCYLEGKTNDQAAEVLGCPRGSMAARLARAKERLRQCLARRGFVVPSASIATALAPAATRAAVPLPLVNNTVRAALWFVREDVCAGGFISARVVALARGALRATLLNRLKNTAALLLTVAVLGTGAAVLLTAAPQAVAPATPETRPGRAEPPGAVPDRGANAAVSYGRAFLALRRVSGDKEKIVADCLTMPLDAHAREIVTQAAYVLRMMQRGAARPNCDWAVDLEQGIELDFPRAKGVRVLSGLACLRARLRFAEGKSAEAIEDIVAALTLARYVSRDGTLDSLWAGYAIEQLMSETLARELPRLNARTVKDLQRRLGALPRGGSVATATMRMEESMLDWIVGEVKEGKDQDSLLAFLSQLCGGSAEPPEKRREKGRACLKECGGSGAGVLRRAEEMQRAYARLSKTLDLPPDQVAKEFEREEMKLADNPVFKVFAPVLHNVRSRQAQAEVRRGLLSAALAVQLNGRGALKSHPDPIVGGPFDYAAFEGGFELRSKWSLDEKLRAKWTLDPIGPLVLTVGRRGK